MEKYNLLWNEVYSEDQTQPKPRLGVVLLNLFLKYCYIYLNYKHTPLNVCIVYFK